VIERCVITNDTWWSPKKDYYLLKLGCILPVK